MGKLSLDRDRKQAHRSTELRRAIVAMNRDQLLSEYPLLAQLGQAQPSLISECTGIVRRFIGFRNAVAPLVDRPDSLSPGVYDESVTSILRLAAEHRMFSMALPQSLGGSGCTMLTLSIGLEQLSQTCAGIANLLATHGLALAVVGAAGSLRCLRQLAERIVEGELQREAYLLCTAATEPSAGSDIEDFDELQQARIESIAVSVAGGYRLNGRKIYVSNGSLASAAVVVMPTDRQNPRESLTAFLVSRETRGLSVARTETKLGQRVSPAAELFFDSCFVPDQARISTGTVAGRTLDLVLGSSRSVVGAFGAGIARGVYDTCLRLSKSRRADGTTLFEQSSTKSLLGRMWTNANEARSSYVEANIANAQFGLVSFMGNEAIRLMDRIVPQSLVKSFAARKLFELPAMDEQARRIMARLPTSHVAIASCHGAACKVISSELALRNCELSLELLGADATRESTGLPKFYRDARLLPIYEGTNDICLLDAAKKANLAWGQT